MAHYGLAQLPSKKKKRSPGPLRPRSDTKQKKRVHLAQPLAQIPNKKTGPDSKQTKKTAPGAPRLGSDTKQKKKRAPGTLRPGSDTIQKKRDHQAQKENKTKIEVSQLTMKKYSARIALSWS